MNIRKIQRVLAPLLGPLAYPYAYFARRRRQFYTQGYKKSFKPRSVTVSVGNIAAGGTGKTPLTSWILGWAQRFDYETVVLTRGYGGKTGGRPVVVSAGTNPTHCGDEPLLLARKHPEATVIAFPKRRVSIQLAERFLVPDLVVLDDGMQHLAIQRDIDLVVLKEKDLGEGWNKVIPAGEWREDVSALEVADAFLIKANAQKFSELRPALLERLEAFKKPVFSFELVVNGLIRVRGFCPQKHEHDTSGARNNSREKFDIDVISVEKTNTDNVITDTCTTGNQCHVNNSSEANTNTAAEADPTQSHIHSVRHGSRAGDYIATSDLKNFGDYILVSGVGEPKQVIETVTTCFGVAPTHSFCYPDHHTFTTQDITQMQCHNLPVICTEKDAVKLEQFMLSVPFYALDVSVAFGENCLSDVGFEQWFEVLYQSLQQNQGEMNQQDSN